MVAQIKTLLATILPTWSGFIPAPITTSCIYMRSNTLKEYTSLNGFSSLYDHTFELQIIAKEYSDMLTYFEAVRAKIKSIQFTTQTYYIQSVEIADSAPETWDSESKLNSKTLIFTISYQK